MRGALGVLVLALGAMSALGQEAPAENGPIPEGAAQPAPIVRAASPLGFPMEPDMTPPKVVKAVAAIYPQDVPVDGENVRCMYYVIIGADGAPQILRKMRSAGDALDAAALAAVLATQYEAGVREGKAVPIRTIVRVSFTGDHAAAIPEIVQRTLQPVSDSDAANAPPRVVSSAEPEFSEAARKKKISGNVMVSALIDEQGLPTEVHVTKGLGYGLDEKAVEAVEQYRFRPAMKSGKAIAQQIFISVNFQIF